MTTDQNECLFCWNPESDCVCYDSEIATKTYFLNFFVSAMKEFAPRKAAKISVYDAVDFVNDFYETHFDREMNSD